MSLRVVEGDLLEINADAIVNSANLFYSKGGGICKKIHDKAGFEFTMLCSKIKPGKYCDVQLTPGFDLPFEYVIRDLLSDNPSFRHDTAIISADGQPNHR